MTRDRQIHSASLSRLLIAALATLLAICATSFAASGLATAAPSQIDTPECASGVDFLGFSDALNKQTFDGTSVGGLSALTYVGRRGVYYSLVDNGPNDDSEARFYTLRLLTRGGELGEPEILDGKPRSWSL